MRVFIIRHAIAAERSPEIPDDARPLTGRGKKRFRQAARGLARLFRRPGHLLPSPVVRARQTARIAGRAWKTSFKEEGALAGGSVQEVDAVLQRDQAGASAQA